MGYSVVYHIDPHPSPVVLVGIESVNGQLNMNIEANTIDNVTGNLRAVEINEYTSRWEHLKGIPFPKIGKKCKVDMLIGLDYADLHQSLHEIRGKPGEPVARLTPLGWTCVGNLEKTNNGTYHTFLLHKDSNHLNETLKQFWELEEGLLFNKDNLYSQSDKNILENAEKSIIKSDGRYQIDIPWKDNKFQLTNNYEMAKKRLLNTEKRLNRQPELYNKYDQIFKDYEKKSYVTRVTDNSDESWYIPHFPVIKPDRQTTKVRIVFDASAKHGDFSLNDTIHQGPPLQNDLFDILLRFRRNSVAIACDVQEMYLQIGIPVSDRQYHRFLWRSSPEEDIKDYQFNRLVFGVNASPFLAQCVSQYNARLYQDAYPMAAETILKSTYMDDSIDSVNNENEGVELYHQLSTLWGKAGMFARKWLSNSAKVLESIPKSDRALDNDLLLDQSEKLSVKTLGVLWQANTDNFTFKSNCSLIEQSSFISKRGYLSKISTLYDPLGFLVPFTIQAKNLMQDVWLSGVDWDDELPPHLANRACKWFEELYGLNQIFVPRNLHFDQNESQVHTFVDASTQAYCAVTYIRNIQCLQNYNTNLIAARSKVVPLKSISIPRLELMAAILGLRLSEKICKALKFDIHKVHFWSDSLNTLWWIRNQSRLYKPFVANRIGEIQSKTDPTQWRHVPSQLNPADCGSRGLSVSELKNKALWWEGPSFLSEDPCKWPENKFQQYEAAKVEQKRKTESSFYVDSKISIWSENRLNPENYSNWNHLVRVQAWVLRFISNCQLKRGDRYTARILSPGELKSSEESIIIQVQRKHFTEEYNALLFHRTLPKSSKLLKLNPKLDESNVMRSESRLRYIEYLPFDTRCPIILPRKAWVTRLIVKHYHEQCYHSGTNQTLANLSSRYWIIAAREIIREIESDCTVCKRRNAKASQQIMGPIPEFRVGRSMRAFSQTAIDYAGPYFTKQGRGKSRNKRYLCLFTCMTYRAVHLELSYGLDTDSFMNAFYRFVSRRGIPEIVVSDNGSNFIGAVRELKELHAALDFDTITKNAANKGIKWYFNPPMAPHFGGIHESMIKSAKRAIFAIMGNADINDEELHTAFVGAESLINSRPLTYQSANSCDEPVLTPNHFLFGQIGGQFAPESVDIINFNLRKRWRRVQELIKHFWKRWLQEFLPMLGSRKKWQVENRDFRVGDIVMVIDPDSARGHWRLGKIVEVFKGLDNHVRVVNVRVGQKILKRPINRISTLVESSHSDV